VARRLQFALTADCRGVISPFNRRARKCEINQRPSSSRYEMRIHGRIVVPNSPPNIIPNSRPMGTPEIAAVPKEVAPITVPTASPPIRPPTTPSTEQTIIPPTAPATTPTLPIPPTIPPIRIQTAIMLPTRRTVEVRLFDFLMQTSTSGGTWFRPVNDGRDSARSLLVIGSLERGSRFSLKTHRPSNYRARSDDWRS
jgi:hypothetical protein